ncbi:cobalamin biosynthesis protein CobD [Ktedonobacteria bacterium brp13]|nr:cobalamin biosynthesis protein CobD [Ktedonobacteria bacterium brp13]
MTRETSKQQQKRNNGMPVAEILTVLVAFGVDAIGEPPVALHPVVWYGKLIRWLERRAPGQPFPQLLYGMLMVGSAAPFAILPARALQRIARCFNRSCYISDHASGYTNAGIVLSALIEGLSLKPFFALKMLVSAGKSVRCALEQQDLPAAREALQQLVSRDRSQLSTELVAAAAIESLAENVSDSVTAPLFYYALFGLPGAAFYRLCNTFDSMIGYHGRYEYLGKFAARFDDVLNYLPSRLSALLIIALAPLYRGNRRAAWQIWRRDASKTESPNAGHPMAAAAGALEIQLEKVDHYILGDAHRAPAAQDIRQAERMVWCVGGSALLLTVLVKLFWRSLRWNR